MVTTTNITQAEPVHFRVQEVSPHPFPQLARSETVVLRIVRAGKGGGINFEMSLRQFLPYRDAVEEAIRSGALYWVDWDYSKTPTFPPPMNDTTLDRLLKAIKDRQFVRSDTDDT